MKNFGNNIWMGILNIIYRIHSSESIGAMGDTILKQIQWLVPFDHALFFIPRENGEIHVVASEGIEDCYIDLYENNFKRYDYASGIKIAGNSIVYKDSDIIEEKVFLSSSFYNQFCRPNHIAYGIHIVISFEGNYCGEVVLFRDDNTINAIDFGENAEFILNLLKEHLSIASSRFLQDKSSRIEMVDGNEFFASPVEKYRVMYNLTKRESEVLMLLLEDVSTTQMCDELIISLNTLKKHIANLYKKMDVGSRVQLLQKIKI
ncbi:MAG: helix-turn-helix transcriptional regulator [Eubacteriales bacterium]|nr:helix-turn-helix transcriptional regulator [Eubacteriales bacterium]